MDAINDANNHNHNNKYFNKTFSNFKISSANKLENTNISLKKLIPDHLQDQQQYNTKNTTKFKNTIRSIQPLDKKKGLIEKIAIALKVKHYNTFKAQNYSTANLISDLNKLVQPIELENYDRNSENISITKFEKYILQKLPRSNSNNNFSNTITNFNNRGRDINEVNSYDKYIHTENNVNGENKGMKIQSLNKTDISVNKTDKFNNVEKDEKGKKLGQGKVFDLRQANKISYEDLVKFKSQKEFNLRLNEQDSWACMIKQNSLNYLNEIEENKKQIQFKKKILNDQLLAQIKEKQKIKEKLNNSDNNMFLTYLKDANNKYNFEESQKNQKLRQKLLELDKSRGKFIKESQRIHRENYLKDKNEELTILNTVKSELASENEKLNRKREERLKYGEFLCQDKLNRITLQKNEQQKEFEDYNRKLLEYNEIQDKLEEERKRIRDHPKNLYKSTEKYFVGKTEELKCTKEENERRFQRDVEEIENRY